MVRLREARRAFKRFHANCFWSSPKDYVVTMEDIPWVARQVMTHGGREGWLTGARAIVRQGEEATKVEWAHDSAWRFLPTVRRPDSGYQLSDIDLAVNKLLALVGRDEPRDYLDVHQAMELLPLGALCWAAAGKDPGFTPAMLLDLLRRRGRYRPEDFARLHLAEPVDLPKLKVRWLSALDAAERFFATRDPSEVGCLYYSRALGHFVEPKPGDEVAPHYGRPGGVLPAVG
ncbi:MAG: hypothetical protein ABSB49_21115 [Polyangia bacterium]|jgi:hypothetical protein